MSRRGPFTTKRSKAPDSGPALCELCREPERTPGDFVTYEGYLVCAECRAQHGANLSRMRDEERSR
jgi:hypothetical protein